MSGPDARRPGVDLLRGLGLLVDGPARWGARIPADGPGLYVVEWPQAEERAPIDHGLLRAWLERVPGLRLDGALPTPHDLAARLSSFWIAGETLVYIGATPRSLRGRLAAQVATPLGDRRPFAGGHWLKTLHGLEQARVWWASTGAPEEYADALFDAFGAGLTEPTALPFANLDAPGGRRRAHGLSGALLDAPEAQPRPTGAAGSQPAGTRPAGDGRRGTPAGARGRPARSAGRAGSPVPTSASGRPRAAARKAPPRPIEPAYLSAEGLARIQTELADLREVQRPQVIARIGTARELGDLKENSEYHAAREEQSFLEGRVLQLQSLVDRAVIVEERGGGGRVALGSRVEVEPAAGGNRLALTIVGTAEADSRTGRVSDRSPMGQALLGHGLGDEVVVRTPGGEQRYVIRALA